jgi:diadenosine tetraphosphate (Ap4A) HIT family hydrolase
MTDLEEAKAKGIAPWDSLAWEDIHISVFKDRYPVNPGHLLFVPKYNNDDIIKDCFVSALMHGRGMVKAGHWDGFNIGINVGKVAGQTVMYPHVHLIPRFDGDCEDPTGGVRHVIPGKGNYRK